MVDAVMDEEGRHLASVDAHNPQGVVGRRNQVQVEVVDRAVASSAVVVDVVPAPGVGMAPLQDGVEASDQDLVGKLAGDSLDLGDSWDFARPVLDRSFRQL